MSKSAFNFSAGESQSALGDYFSLHVIFFLCVGQGMGICVKTMSGSGQGTWTCECVYVYVS